MSNTGCMYCSFKRERERERIYCRVWRKCLWCIMANPETRNYFTGASASCHGFQEAVTPRSFSENLWVLMSAQWYPHTSECALPIFNNAGMSWGSTAVTLTKCSTRNTFYEQTNHIIRMNFVGLGSFPSSFANFWAFLCIFWGEENQFYSCHSIWQS